MSVEDQEIPVIAKFLVPKERKEAKLGMVLADYFNSQLKPMQKQCAKIEQVWNEIIDPQMGLHCRCGGIKAGVVEIKVDSPVYVYQLSLQKDQLLEQIREAAPGLKAKKLKVVLG